MTLASTAARSPPDPRARRPCLARITALLRVDGAAVLALGHALPGVEPFAFARERSILWVAVLLLYPILSALPQELIFRVFFFHRYRVPSPPPGSSPC